MPEHPVLRDAPVRTVLITRPPRAGARRPAAAIAVDPPGPISLAPHGRRPAPGQVPVDEQPTSALIRRVTIGSTSRARDWHFGCWLRVLMHPTDAGLLAIFHGRSMSTTRPRIGGDGPHKKLTISRLATVVAMARAEAEGMVTPALLAAMSASTRLENDGWPGEREWEASIAAARSFGLPTPAAWQSPWSALAPVRAWIAERAATSLAADGTLRESEDAPAHALLTALEELPWHCRPPVFVAIAAALAPYAPDGVGRLAFYNAMERRANEPSYGARRAALVVIAAQDPSPSAGRWAADRVSLPTNAPFCLDEAWEPRTETEQPCSLSALVIPELVARHPETAADKAREYMSKGMPVLAIDYAGTLPMDDLMRLVLETRHRSRDFGMTVLTSSFRADLAMYGDDSTTWPLDASWSERLSRAWNAGVSSPGQLRRLADLVPDVGDLIPVPQRPLWQWAALHATYQDVSALARNVPAVALPAILDRLLHLNEDRVLETIPGRLRTGALRWTPEVVAAALCCASEPLRHQALGEGMSALEANPDGTLAIPQPEVAAAPVPDATLRHRVRSGRIL